MSGPLPVRMLTLASIIVAGCEADLSDHPSAQKIRAEAGRALVGWRGVANAIASTDHLRAHVLTQICSGAPEWLEVGRILLPTSYVHLNEELVSAAATALTVSPTQVLQSFGPEVCGGPDDLPPGCDVSRWHERAEATLAHVDDQNDPDAAQAKSRCARAVERSAPSNKAVGADARMDRSSSAANGGGRAPLNRER
jgi:hypothetical protein